MLPIISKNLNFALKKKIQKEKKKIEKFMNNLIKEIKIIIINCLLYS